MKKYLLAHDLGTSGNKATLYSTEGELVKSCVHSYDMLVSNNNWVEQRPEDFWNAVCVSTKELVQDIDVNDIAAISFSGQMMGCICVDKEGRALRNALIWADMRATKEEEMIRERISEEDFYHLTGHKISPSYGGQKLMWVKNNEPEIYENTYKMLNCKDYIILKLTGEFVTEYTDASSTNLLDLNKLEWSDRLLEVMGIDREKMPALLKSTDVAGTVTDEAAKACGLVSGIPVVCGGGDGVCAAVGTGCTKEGIATAVWVHPHGFPSQQKNQSTMKKCAPLPGRTLCQAMYCQQEPCSAEAAPTAGLQRSCVSTKACWANSRGSANMTFWNRKLAILSQEPMDCCSYLT